MAAQSRSAKAANASTVANEASKEMVVEGCARVMVTVEADITPTSAMLSHS